MYVSKPHSMLSYAKASFPAQGMLIHILMNVEPNIMVFVADDTMI
jgi:hypothetical protein